MMTDESNAGRTIIRVRDTGRGGRPHNNTLKRWEDKGLFPKRRPFGPGIVGWWADEFEKALDEMKDHPAVQEAHERLKEMNASASATASRAV